MPPSDFRADINGLRGLSVALVVAYHLQLRGAAGGFVGVDVFFVVSGYLMTRILLGHDASLRAYLEFVVARARRIWPALAVLVALLVVAGSVALPPFDLLRLARQALWALAFASNHFYLAHSGYADRTADSLWLLHAWSLSVEWQFYLLYPLLLALPWAVLRRWRPAAALPAQRRALLWVLVAAVVVSLGWQRLQRGEPLEAGFFLLASRAWEMLAGGVVFLLAAERPLGGRSARWTAHAGVALIGASVVALALLRQRAVGQDLALLGPVLGAGLVLWAADSANPLLRPALLQALGRWSYSIYLWHWPILVAARLTPWWHEQRLATGVAAVVLSLLAGAASYRWVERPFLSRASRVSSASGASRGDGGRGWRGLARPGAVLGLALALAGAAAWTQGLVQRGQGGTLDVSRYEASTLPLLFPDARCGNFKLPVAQMALCSTGPSAQRRVLVIGDSHAGHLWPWFTKHAQVPVDFFQASECPPVPHFERLQPGYDCKDYAERAWQRARSADYDTVVVSARWATVGLAGPPYCHEAPGRACDAVDGPRRQALVLDELRGAIERTLQAGKTVVVLDSAPEAAVRVPERLAREQFWHGAPRYTIERSTLTAANAWVDALFERLRAQPGFHRVSLRDTLCDERRCRVYDTTLARPVYMDESHFDPLWIAENARFFEPFVQRDRPPRPHSP